MDLPTDLQVLWVDIWKDLSGAADRREGPFRLPAIATIDPARGPQVRTVVLRGVDARAGQLEFFTDRRSPKVSQIKNNPRVAWHFWNPESGIQIRVDSLAELHSDDSYAEGRWRECPLASRLPYWKANSPGMEINHPQVDQLPPVVEEQDLERGREYFVAVVCRVDRLDYYQMLPSARGMEFARAEWILPTVGEDRVKMARGAWIAW